MSDTIPGFWQPETEEEMDLYEDLLTLTSRAFRDGMERDRLTGALLNVATVVVLHEEDGQEGSEVPGEVAVPCPECALPITSVHSGLGGHYVVIHEDMEEYCTVRMEGNEHLEDLR